MTHDDPAMRPDINEVLNILSTKMNAFEHENGDDDDLGLGFHSGRG